MTTWIGAALAGAAVAVMCLTATAAARRPSTEWAYFHFDGGGFVAGEPARGTPFLAVRPGLWPVVVTEPAKVKETGLPRGNGAVAGICYVQSAGGKLRPSPGYLPVSGVAVRIFAGEKEVTTVESDANGYFLAALPPGRYRISAKQSVEVEVKKGNTTLVPLRVGKRMVD